jgi:quercetin dioxygenase-like cupin family protein
MKHVLDTRELAWRGFDVAGVSGYEIKQSVIGNEYTDAYSVDIVRVAPGGYSSAHIDEGRHAFFILEGRGRLVLGEQAHEFGAGDVVKVPPKVVHEVHNDASEPLVFLTIYDPPRVRK